VGPFRGRFRQLAVATGSRTARARRYGRACHGGWAPTAVRSFRRRRGGGLTAMGWC